MVRLVRMQEREGNSGERTGHKRRKKRMANQVVPIIKVSRRARGQMHFVRETNENKNRTKASHIPRKHQKRLFDIGLSFIGWFGCFPWEGGPPASDPDA